MASQQPKSFEAVMNNLNGALAQIREGSLMSHGPYKGVADAGGSLTNLLKPYIVEPIVITTHSARNSKAFDNSVTMLTNVFTSFYIQAFRIMVDHHGMSVSSTVDALSSDKKNSSWGKLTTNIIAKEEHPLYNPYRDLMVGAETDGMFLRQNHPKILAKFGIVSRETSVPSGDPTLDFLASQTDQFGKGTQQYKKDTEPPKEEPKPEISNRKAILKSPIADANSDPLYKIHVRQITLSFDVGKGDNNGKTVTVEVPIMIKTTVVAVPVAEISGILDHNSPDTNFSDRLIGLLGGTVKFKDFILASDLVERYKQNRLKDATGILRTIRERSSKRQLDNKSVMKGFENYYNLMLITTEDKLQIDRIMGVSIHEERGKERFLKETRSLCGVILDEDYERITMLVSNIRGVSTFGYKALKNKKEMDAFEDIMKAILATKPVSF